MSYRDDLPHHPEEPEGGGLVSVWTLGALVLVLLYILALIFVVGRR